MQDSWMPFISFPKRTLNMSTGCWLMSKETVPHLLDALVMKLYPMKHSEQNQNALHVIIGMCFCGSHDALIKCHSNVQLDLCTECNSLLANCLPRIIKSNKIWVKKGCRMRIKQSHDLFKSHVSVSKWRLVVSFFQLLTFLYKLR